MTKIEEQHILENFVRTLTSRLSFGNTLFYSSEVLAILVPAVMQINDLAYGHPQVVVGHALVIGGCVRFNPAEIPYLFVFLGEISLQAIQVSEQKLTAPLL